VIGVDLHALDDSTLGKSDDRPVISGAATPFRFPPIAHVR
jgi:hypothetical protein